MGREYPNWDDIHVKKITIINTYLLFGKLPLRCSIGDGPNYHVQQEYAHKKDFFRRYRDKDLSQFFAIFEIF